MAIKCFYACILKKALFYYLIEDFTQIGLQKTTFMEILKQRIQ